METQVEKAFQDLQASFDIAPILMHSLFTKVFYIETNVFDFALIVVLSHMGMRSSTVLSSILEKI